MSGPLEPTEPAAAEEAGRAEVVPDDAVVRPSRYVRWAGAAMGGLRVGVRLVAVPIVATGVLALVLGLAAWHLDQPAVEIVVVVSLAAICLPIFVAVRLAEVTRALSDPRQVASQAGDLLVQAGRSPELTRILGRVRSRGGTRSEPAGRTRRLLGGLRTVKGALDAVQPDPGRHDRLVRLTPEQLRRVWFATLGSLWAWLGAAVVATWAIVALALRTI